MKQQGIRHYYDPDFLDTSDPGMPTPYADPKATSELAQSISAWPKSSPGYFRDVQNKLKRFVESGQLGPFANAYWGSPAYKLPPEANLMAVTHYLEALDFQKEIVKIHTIFGGRNPHPNWVVGGMPCSINVDDAGAVGAVNMAWLNLVSDVIDQTIAFTDQVYSNNDGTQAWASDWVEFGDDGAPDNGKIKIDKEMLRIEDKDRGIQRAAVRLQDHLGDPRGGRAARRIGGGDR